MNHQKNIPIVFAAIVCSLFLSACASSRGNKQVRNYTPDQISQSIQKGVTSKAQVNGVFGNPNFVVKTPAGHDLWVYRNITSSPKAANFIPVVGSALSSYDTNTKEVVVEFGENGIVFDYAHRETDQVIATGLLAQKQQQDQKQQQEKKRE